MKIIGIMTRINDSKLTIPKKIYKKIKDKVNVIAIPFDETDTFKDVFKRLNLCNGVIIPGGGDINEIELNIAKYLYDNNIPTLGICLGMQTMAVAIEGNLGHLNEEEKEIHKKVGEYYSHEISINKESKLYTILKDNHIKVNSRHEDYIIDTKLNKTSFCNNIIESVEDPNKKFYIGVQYHPEDIDDIYSDRLFNAFIDSVENEKEL